MGTSDFEKMPALQISRETIEMLRTWLSKEEAANVLFALNDYFDGVINDLTPNEEKAFKLALKYTEQKALEWERKHQKQVEAAKRTNEARWGTKTDNTNTEFNNYKETI